MSESRIASFFHSAGGFFGPGMLTVALGGRVENGGPPSLKDAISKRSVLPPVNLPPGNTAPPPPSLADAIKRGNR